MPPIASVATQLQAIGPIDLKLLSQKPLASWPRILLGGKQYILEDWIAKKRGRKSWIADHGSFLKEVTESGIIGTICWCCKYCNKSFTATATSHASAHVQDHGYFDPAKPDYPSMKPKMLSVAEQLQAAAAAAPVTKPTAEAVTDLVLSWIVSSDQPFNAVENPYLRKLFQLLSRYPQLIHWVPTSGRTTRRNMDAWYEQEKKALQATLASASFKKHLSFDTWTSPNSTALLAIVAHFINNKFELQTTLLAMVQLKSSHTGEAQATEILAIIKDFGIQPSVGYFQCDNISSNDTCIATLLGHFPPNLTSPDVLGDKKERRLRCLGHIINLVAKAFIAQANTRGWQEEDDKPGLIKRLHNIVHFIRRSPRRREAFARVMEFRQTPATEVDKFNLFLTGSDDPTPDDPAPSLQLVADNETRWNSTYFMVERAIKLRESIDLYYVHSVAEKDGISAKDILKDNDWETLVELQAVLRPFALVTKRFEGNGPTLPSVVQALYYLRESLANYRLEPAG